MKLSDIFMTFPLITIFIIEYYFALTPTFSQRERELGDSFHFLHIRYLGQFIDNYHQFVDAVNFNCEFTTYHLLGFVG